MAGQVVDFDRWRAERAAKDKDSTAKPAPVFRIGGKDYPMPAEPPATIAIDVIRLKTKMEQSTDGVEAAIPVEAFVNIGEGIFGPVVFRQMCIDHEIGAAEIGDVIMQAFQVWQHLDAAEGEARPNRKTRRRKPSTS